MYHDMSLLKCTVALSHYRRVVVHISCCYLFYFNKNMTLKNADEAMKQTLNSKSKCKTLFNPAILDSNCLKLLFLQQHLTLPPPDSFPRASATSLGFFNPNPNYGAD